MSDTVKTWIEERQAIHAKAKEYPVVVPQSPTWMDALKARGEYELDAKVNFPRALDTLNKVLELHKPFEWSFGYGPVQSCAECSRLSGNEGDSMYPCPTVQAIEGAINE